MKILLVNYSEVTSPGGVHKTILEIATKLSSEGHEIFVLQDNPNDLPKKEKFNGFNIIRVKSIAAKYLYGFSPEIVFFLKKNFKKLNPDIVHVHGYHSLFSIEIIHLIKNIDSDVPIIFSPHLGVFSRRTIGGKYLWGFYNKFIGKRMLDSCDLIIAASKFESENLKKIFKISKEKIKIIPHGVNFIDTNKDIPNNGKINLLYVGYLLELKGVHYILESVHELIYNRDLDVCLTIVGEGPYKNKLKNIAKRLKINQFIIWEDFIPSKKYEKLLKFYKNADILLLLSQSENYGIVISEALAAGTPVIVTKRTALNEFLNECGCFGVNYPPNPEEVANLIIKVNGNDLKLGSFSSKIMTWKDVSNNYERIYSKFQGIRDYANK